MRTIFLLELENYKYFVFASSFINSTHSPIELFLEASLSYEYIRKYKPLNILDYWKETHLFDVDTQLKKQMLVYGIDNVRGGSYSSIVLTPEQIAFLSVELTPNSNPHISSVIKGIFDKYANSPWTNENLILERESIKTKYAKYRLEKGLCDKLLKLNIPQTKTDIDWLENMCEIQRKSFITGHRHSPVYRMSKDNNLQKYRNVLSKMREIYETFMTITDKMPIMNENLPIKYPEFLFDDYMFHGYYINKHTDNVHWLCEQYRFFLLFIENRLEEYEFDKDSWGMYPEDTFTTTIALLDMCIIIK